MAFDRAGAKAAGYSDAEIDAYLAQPSAPAPAGAAESRFPEGYNPGHGGAGPYQGGTADEIEANPISPVDLIVDVLTGGLAGARRLPGVPGVESALGAARAVPGAIRGATAASARTAGRVASAPVLRHIPGAGKVRNVAEDVVGLAESRVAKPKGRVVGEIKPVKAKPARPKKKAAAKAKAETGTAESRTMTATEQAGARAKGRAQVGGKSQAMRGQSGPSLERRARMPKAEADDLKDLLEQSIEVEVNMAGKGLSQSERSFVRSSLRGAEPEGSVAARVAKPGAGSRHEVQYYSESQGKFIPIETMHIAQLKNAMNKLHRKLMSSNRPAPVTKKQFEALRDEVTHRLNEAGELTVY